MKTKRNIHKEKFQILIMFAVLIYRGYNELEIMVHNL